MNIEKKRTKQITKIKEKIVKVERVERSNPKSDEARYKLSRQLDSLKKAYKSGYISNETYTKSKNTIERAMRGPPRKLKKGV